MLGFLGKTTNQLPANFKKEERKSLVVDKISSGGFYVERRTINKFVNDKVFAENEKYIVVTEGVIFNRTKLESNYKDV